MNLDQSSYDLFYIFVDCNKLSATYIISVNNISYFVNLSLCRLDYSLAVRYSRLGVGV